MSSASSGTLALTPSPTHQDHGSSSTELPIHETSNMDFNRENALGQFHGHFYKILSSDEASLILDKILQIQITLLPGQSQTLDQSDLFPYTVIVEPKHFQVITGHAGHGGESTVEHGPLFPTTQFTLKGTPFTPKKTKPMARKRRLNEKAPGFSPMARKFRKVISPDKNVPIDQSLSTTRNVDNTNPMSLNNYYSSDFTGVNFKDMNHPVQHLLKMFIAILPGMIYLHEKNQVIRDIKPANMLAHDDASKCVLTDLALHESIDTKGKVFGTPRYLNPRSSGSRKEYLYEQSKRRGLQRPCDDMVATAQSGLECLVNLIRQLNPSTWPTMQCVAYSTTTAKPNNHKLKFSKEEFNTLHRDFPYRAYFKRGKNGQADQVKIFERLQHRHKILNDAIDTLNLPLPEKTALINFGIICFKMLAATDIKRYSAKGMRERLNKILSACPATKQKRQTDLMRAPKKIKRAKKNPRTTPPSAQRALSFD